MFILLKIYPTDKKVEPIFVSKRGRQSRNVNASSQVVLSISPISRLGGLCRGALKWAKYSDSEQQYVTLNNGLRMPLLGLGTSSSNGQEGENAVKHALKVGYK